MRILFLFCLMLLTVDCRAAAPELYGELNRLRAGEGHCGTTRLPRLTPQAALESAARALARGDTLEHGVTATGYRATQTSFFSFSGDGVDVRAEQLLATRADCRALMDPAMTDVGIYVDARELRVVLAAPFSPAVRMSEETAGQRVLELINEARASPRACGN